MSINGNGFNSQLPLSLFGQATQAKAASAAQPATSVNPLANTLGQKMAAPSTLGSSMASAPNSMEALNQFFSMLVMLLSQLLNVGSPAAQPAANATGNAASAANNAASAQPQQAMFDSEPVANTAAVDNKTNDNASSSYDMGELAPLLEELIAKLDSKGTETPQANADYQAKPEPNPKNEAATPKTSGATQQDEQTITTTYAPIKKDEQAAPKPHVPVIKHEQAAPKPHVPVTKHEPAAPKPHVPVTKHVPAKPKPQAPVTKHEPAKPAPKPASPVGNGNTSVAKDGSTAVTTTNVAGNDVNNTTTVYNITIKVKGNKNKKGKMGADIAQNYTNAPKADGAVPKTFSHTPKSNAEVPNQYSNTPKGSGDIASNNNNVVKGQGDIASNSTNVIEGKGDIASNNMNVIEGKGDIASTSANVVKGQGDIASNNNNVVKGQGDIASTSTNVVEGNGNISSNNSNVISGTVVTADKYSTTPKAAGDIASNSTNVVKGQGDIASNNNNVIEGKGSIASNSTNVIGGAKPSKPVTPPPAYEDGKDGKFYGDPHFVGFGGEKYDVMGQPGKTYNVISDKAFQYNAEFAAWGRPTKDGVQSTVIGKAGLQVGKSRVQIDRNNPIPTVNGKPMVKGQKYTLDNNGSAIWDGKKLSVKSLEYTADLEVKQHKTGPYIDSNVKLSEGVNPLADGVTPHGLLGQTADGIKGERKGINNIKDPKQGGTVIDGTVKDYEVKTLFDTSFTKNNRFNK